MSMMSLAAFHLPGTARLWGGLALFQAQDSINSGNSKLLMIFIGLAAFALLTQAAVVAALGLGALKAQKRLMEIAEQLHAKAMPLIENSHNIVLDLTPKIKDVSSNVQHISFVVREKVDEILPTVSAANATVKDANSKTHEQIVRVNGMITDALNATQDLAAKVQEGVKVPGREVTRVVTAVKSKAEAFAHGVRGFADSMKSLRAERAAAKRRTAPSAGSRTAYSTHTGRTAQDEDAAAASARATAAAAAAFERAEKPDMGL